MARTDVRYREAFNSLLDICASLDVNSQLPSEVSLAEQVAVSRTVVRNALQRLHNENIILWEGRAKTLIRSPRAKDRLEVPEQSTSIDELQSIFLNWVVRFDVPPGTALNITQLSKQFIVAPHTLQEFLASLARFGLVERRERGGWVLLGFTADYAVELSEFRSVLEVNAMRVLMGLPKDHPVWGKLTILREQHVALLERINTDYHDFSSLDEKFHMTINSVVKNRFIVDFQKIISLIFHYHYQWNKSNERERNEAAIKEHINWIDALQSGKLNVAEKAAKIHLNSSKETLLASLETHKLT